MKKVGIISGIIGIICIIIAVVVIMNSPSDSPHSPVSPQPLATFESITITGTGYKTSPPFKVTTQEWIIEWSYITDYQYPEYAGFSFYIFPRGETAMYIKAISSAEPNGSTYSYDGPGEYYIEVLAANINSWTITISPAE